MKTLNKFMMLVVIGLGLSSPGFSEEPELCTDVSPGINLAGAEFTPNVLPGRLYWEYFFPDSDQLNYYKIKGFKSVRLPVLWERLQPELYGDLDYGYLFEIQYFLEQANQVGMCVLLDLHNFGRYRGEVVGTPVVPAEAFYDVWKRVAEALSSYPALYAYGLMNEPHDTGGLWHLVAQFGVDAVRSVDTERGIYVSGEDWSNAWKWPVANPVPFVTDSQNKIVYEAHIYFDSDFSGIYWNPDDILKAKAVEERVMPFILWLRQYGVKGAIGEWGVPTRDPRWFTVAGKFLSLADANELDWYVWAGGAWSENYVLSLEPIDGEDKPLTKFISNRIK